jgi:asparagine synthase (glutamine-hydrolysing)
MCGITAVINSKQDANELRKRLVAYSARLRHRGPDWSGISVQQGKQLNILVHERLAIVDVETGAQPLKNEAGNISLTVNGEIYNHEQLEATALKEKHAFATKSDCEVIVHLYEEVGDDLVDKLEGDFAFVLADDTKFLAARDPIGVCPLYYGYGEDGSIWFASELKALKDACKEFHEFPPGHLYSDKSGGLKRYYNPPWWDEAIIPTARPTLPELRTALEDAVVRRMMCDVPYGVLLSGGLDSSLVAAITARHAEKRIEDHEKTRAWWPRLHSFCIGLPGAPDLAAAKEVAGFLGTVHHEFHFTVQEGIDAIPSVIETLETYDVTTIRASTPMYFLSRRIKAMGVKMVLSGEGSDEIFGGYLYFHKAPNKEEFHKETVRKVKHLHYFDCLRANKSTMAWGVEVRVPFLDKRFLDTAMTIDPELKLCGNGKIEKHLIRSAFDTKERPYLPDNILWRQKEQFSDGVGYSWISSLKEYAEAQVSEADYAEREKRFPINPPQTKEAYWYRTIFEEKYPQESAAKCVHAWVPTWSANTDPSGRVQQVHSAHAEK